MSKKRRITADKLFPRITIVLAGMTLVLIVLNGINSAMNFLNNGLFIFLLILLCVFSILTSILQIFFKRMRDKKH